MSTIEPPVERPFEEDAAFALGNYQAAVNGLSEKLTVAQPASLDMSFKLMQRWMMDALSSLVVLENHSQHDHARDSAIILRAMYDLHIQFLFVLTDPVKHSVNFWNFGAIEKYNMLIMYEQHGPTMTAALQSRPNWAQEKAKVISDYDQLKPAFQYTDGKGKIRVRKNWYGAMGELDKLATPIGKESEYRVIQKRLSAIVHSSSFVLMFPTLVPIESVWTGYRLTMRVVGGIAKYLNVPFDGREQIMYDDAIQEFI